MTSTKTPVACLHCRKKKRKCDREKPSCGTCLKTSASCTYPEPADLISQANRLVLTEQPSKIPAPHELPSQVIGQKLLETYFDNIHSANLLFHRKIAFQLYAQERVPGFLLQAVFAHAAIFLRNVGYLGGTVDDVFGKSWAWARCASAFVLADADEPGIERIQALHVLHGYYFARGDVRRAEIHARVAFELCCVLGYDKMIDDGVSFASMSMTERFAREMKRRCFWACWSTAALRAEPQRSLTLCDMAARCPLPAAFEDGGLTDGVRFKLGPTMQEALSAGDDPLCHMAEIVKALRIWTQVQSFVWTSGEVSDPDWEDELNKLKALIQDSTTYAQGCFEHLEAATGEHSEDIELIVSIRSLHHLNRMLLHAAVIPAFSKHPAAAMVPHDDIWKSADVVLHEANSIVQLFSSRLGRRLDRTRLWPLSGHAVFISGVVLMAYGGVIRTPFNASWIWNALRPDEASFVWVQEMLDFLSQYWEPLRDQSSNISDDRSNRYLMSPECKLSSEFAPLPQSHFEDRSSCCPVRAVDEAAAVRNTALISFAQDDASADMGGRNAVQVGRVCSQRSIYTELRRRALIYAIHGSAPGPQSTTQQCCHDTNVT
ncbi:hypothetical protein AC578_7032 [Pseudocercospora eumusae]|uniref:Zn(2)-C6 fungal-type domain-containing protein n=1 Tax=Pseudocercospora eumusae TaxID=321146 RepID=A0A139HCL4_9PEZI|nr:hypothetical protein AC578_7032 [Pseudocercospora eumusae]